MQILDDRGFPDAINHRGASALSSGPPPEYPPLQKPFHLGELQDMMRRGIQRLPSQTRAPFTSGSGQRPRAAART